MIRFMMYFVLLILLTIFLWGNMENKASLTLMGEPVFTNVPVLIIILGSMFGGMLLMLPFQYLSRLRLSRKLKSRQPASPATAKGVDALKEKTASEIVSPAAPPSDTSGG